MIQKNVFIRDDQQEFMDEHKNFQFSVWIRDMFDEYIKSVRGLHIIDKDGRDEKVKG